MVEPRNRIEKGQPEAARGLAEDVLQDVYMRIWQAAGSYRPEAGPPLPWLITIARNRAIDSVRRKAEVQGPELEPFLVLL